MRKGTLEYCVLSVVDEEESYPTEIIQKLKTHNLIVIEGTLYPLLTRLKNAGFLKYRWQESSEGPPRKYFSLTAEGKKVLEELRNSWQEYSQAVNTITNKSK